MFFSYNSLKGCYYCNIYKNLKRCWQRNSFLTLTAVVFLSFFPPSKYKSKEVERESVIIVKKTKKKKQQQLLSSTQPQPSFYYWWKGNHELIHKRRTTTNCFAELFRQYYHMCNINTIFIFHFNITVTLVYVWRPTKANDILIILSCTLYLKLISNC